MLILAACRDPALPGDRSGELIRMLPADGNTERAALTGLPPVAVAALPASAGQAASPEQAQAVHVETGGNPFLVRELARMRAEHPGAAPSLTAISAASDTRMLLPPVTVTTGVRPRRPQVRRLGDRLVRRGLVAGVYVLGGAAMAWRQPGTSMGTRASWHCLGVIF